MPPSPENRGIVLSAEIFSRCGRFIKPEYLQEELEKTDFRVRRLTEDEMWEVIRAADNHMINDTLFDLTQSGLIDVGIDEEGEFVFTITEKGREVAEKLNAEE